MIKTKAKKPHIKITEKKETDLNIFNNMLVHLSDKGHTLSDIILAIDKIKTDSKNKDLDALYESLSTNHVNYGAVHAVVDIIEYHYLGQR